MRYFIAILLLYCFYSSSLYTERMKNDTAIQKIDKTLSNFSKKKKNSLKIELFSDQIDFLYQSNKHNSLAAVHFIRLLQGSTIHLAKINFDDALNTKFYYNFICQYLYPKHSFW